MKSTASGSMMLIVVLFLSPIVLLVGALWQTTVYVTEHAQLRYEYQNNLNVVESLALYAASITRYNYKEIAQYYEQHHTKELSLPTDLVVEALSIKKYFHASVVVMQEGDSDYAIAATWQPSANQSYTASCRLSKRKTLSDEKTMVTFFITNWQCS